MKFRCSAHTVRLRWFTADPTYAPLSVKHCRVVNDSEPILLERVGAILCRRCDAIAAQLLFMQPARLGGSRSALLAEVEPATLD